jgi:uncharacterized membrane-anchored protein YitT (DUF2179 family)
MPRSCLLCLFLLLLLGTNAVSGQDKLVTNVFYEQMGDSQVVINYDLAGPDQLYTVSVKVSLNNGESYFPLHNATGDVGDGVQPGLARAIVWDVLADFPEGVEVEGEVFFEVVATVMARKKGRSLTYILIGALTAGAGGTLALLLGGSSGDSGPSPSPTPDTGLATPPARPSGN